MLGAAVCVLYFRKRAERRRFKPLWVYILLSFLFYIPVAVGAGAVPILGMLMLPKTICYVLLVSSFLQAVIKDPEAEGQQQIDRNLAPRPLSFRQIARKPIFLLTFSPSRV